MLARLARTRIPAARGLAAVLSSGAHSLQRAKTRAAPSRAFSVTLLSRSATATPSYAASDLSTSQYHAIADATMDSLLDQLEVLVDAQDDSQYEVEYSSGVLTLKLADKGVYVVNKQPPNKQIWLSSPFSGPKRYDYSAEHNAWFYARDGQTLDGLLNQELSTALDGDVLIQLSTQSD